MDIADTAQGKTRWQSQRETIENALPALRDLRTDVEVRFYSFDSAAHPVPWDRDELRLPDTPEGEQSDIDITCHQLLTTSADSARVR